jgi:LacI family transcriptional regulator
VSHVLNRTRYVSDQTRSRVEAAIRETGYRHNSLASALAAGRTRTIGICVPILGNPYVADLLTAVESAAGAEGYTLMIAESADGPEAEGHAVDMFLQRRVDGMIMTPGVESPDTTIPVVLAAGTPLILIDSRVDDADCDQVCAENFESTRRLTAHLLDHGYRELVVVKGTPGVGSTDERFAGFAAALRDRGMSPDRARSVTGYGDADTTTIALRWLFDSGPRPEAVVTLNSAMTIGAMRALRLLGLRVPEDVALVSFDDFEWADLFHPRLTAIAQDVRAIGRRAVDLLFSRIADPELPARDVSIPTTLNIRDSCGGGHRG